MPAPTSRTGIAVPIALLTVLLGLGSLPLIVYRREEESQGSIAALIAIGTVIGLWGLIALVRGWMARRQRAQQPGDLEAALLLAVPAGRDWRRECATVALLGALTWICFYSPMWRCYWRGADDAGLLWTGEDNPVWSAQFDRIAGRPLQMFVGPALSRALAPGKMDGYMWVSGAIWFFSGWLLFLIVRKVFPQHPWLAAAAAALFIISPTEPSRYYVFSTGMSYTSSLCVLLLSFWLVLVAVEKWHSGWLIAACLALGATLLSNEGQFPLAVIGFVLIWAKAADWRSAVVPLYAWFSTLLLLTVRFIVFLVTAGDQSYQLRQAKGTLTSFGQAVKHLGMQFGAIEDYFEPKSFRAFTHYGVALLAVGLTWLLLRLQPSSGERTPPRQHMRRGVMLGCLVILLGVLPFFHMHSVFRTQFFALPGQAVILALIVGLLTTRAPARWARFVPTFGVGFLVFNGTLTAYWLQDSRIEHPSFERMTHVLQQIHGVAPGLTEKDLAVLVRDDEFVDSLGCNYCVNRVAYLLLNTAVVQANYADAAGDRVTFGVDGVHVSGGTGEFCLRMNRSKQTTGDCVYPYERVVAFQLASDGNLQLLEELPFALTPANAPLEKYQPLALLQPTAPEPFRFFRYESSWQVPAEVIPVGEGLVLDEDWSDLVQGEEALYRSGGPEASLIVNPMGQSRRTIRLDVEPGAALAGRESHIRVQNQAGREVASFTLTGRKSVDLDVPLDPQVINTLTFHSDVPAAELTMHGDDVVRLLADAEDADLLQTRFLAGHRPAPPADIHDGTVRLGQNWQGLTTNYGPAFRWVDTDAEIVVPKSASGYGLLEIDVARGPSCGRSMLELTLLDEQGIDVGGNATPERARFRFPLVVSTSRPTSFRLSAVSDRLPVPNDPRILNAQVFGVHFEAVDQLRYEAVLNGRESSSPSGPGGPGGDIVDHSVLLGRLWEPITEHSAGRFRWVDSDAEIIVPSSDGSPSVLEIDVAQGPCCGPGPLTLHLLNERYEHVAAAKLSGRQKVTLPLPQSRERAVYRLACDSQRKPLPKETRILNLQVFRVGVTAVDEARHAELLAEQTALRGREVHDDTVSLGRNWFPIAGPVGASFRWVETQAEVRVPHYPGQRAVLEVDAEPGPSHGLPPMRLALCDATGKEVASASLKRRETVQFELPETHRGGLYRLCVEGKQLPVPNDPRLLNFRVFSLQSYSATSESPSPPSAPQVATEPAATAAGAR